MYILLKDTPTHCLGGELYPAKASVCLNVALGWVPVDQLMMLHRKPAVNFGFPRTTSYCLFVDRWDAALRWGREAKQLIPEILVTRIKNYTRTELFQDRQVGLRRVYLYRTNHSCGDGISKSAAIFCE